MSNKVFLGSELKLNINIEPIDNISMDDYDFTVDVYCSSQETITITKNEAIRIDENNYIVLVDTTKLGTGTIKCKINAYIPDEDFPIDFKRTEVVCINTNIKIVENY